MPKSDSGTPTLQDAVRRRPWRAAVAVLSVLAAVAVTALVGTGWTRSYTPSPLEAGGERTAAAVEPHLRFLGAELRGGAGERMQALFPEGYVFTHALYGLSRANSGTLDPGRREEALAEARWALDRLDSPAGTAPFPRQADPGYGVFHAGWSTYLLARIVELAGGPDAAPGEARRLAADAEEIAAAFDASLADSGSPYLAAYPGQAWPVDSVAAAAALARATEVLRGVQDPEWSEARTATLDAWSAAVRERTDPGTGLIPHRVDAETGAPIGPARGSSQALLLRFLPDVDPAWAAEDYRTFREEFRSGHAWAPGVREFPAGVDGAGDVDSGPLILGLSASASAVALGDAVLYGDEPAAAALTGLGEPLGAAAGGEQRAYLGGALPVGDAFMVWSRTTAGERPAPVPPPGHPPAPPASWWRLPWQAAGVLTAAAAWWGAWRAVRPLLPARTRRPESVQIRTVQ
ncbi:hypothetical protein [Nocardiopsis composta]|uniref:Uncharacterized protein n=1 Tax=Nocardiopsis composta TaxID=157465 RepID=A0A7W8QPJ5_9ACTN|nr:hypothetical protein [Nocardiopsis composta]MBB5434267.1 hypothetical protein [Nocardiopsis composta]